MATLRPNERYAFIGKTRAGKTRTAMVLAGTLAMALANTGWEVWLVTTKGAPDDLIAWREWGFRNIASEEDQSTTVLQNALYFRLDVKDAQGREVSQIDQAQRIFQAAYNRGGVGEPAKVIVVVDEYVSVVPSSRNAGQPLLDIFQRGGGRTVGLIGLTQEPVYVPRQLVSQSTHIFLFTLTHIYDIKYAKSICGEYVPPATRGDPYGFWYKWVDGPTNKWLYYPSQREWYDDLRIAMPRPVEVPEAGLVTGVY